MMFKIRTLISIFSCYICIIISYNINIKDIKLIYLKKFSVFKEMTQISILKKRTSFLIFFYFQIISTDFILLLLLNHFKWFSKDFLGNMLAAVQAPPPSDLCSNHITSGLVIDVNNHLCTKKETEEPEALDRKQQNHQTEEIQLYNS